MIVPIGAWIIDAVCMSVKAELVTTGADHEEHATVAALPEGIAED
jgi:hypothetical protein